MASHPRYQLKGGTFVAYEEGSQPKDIIDQALAEADIPPEPEAWKNGNHREPNIDSHPAMEGQDYNQSSDYGQEYPPSQPGGYYQQPPQPPPPQQYYAASSSSNNSPGSPSTYQPIYPSVGYPASAPAYSTAPPAAGFGYAASEGYTHTSASASQTLNENESELKRLRNTAASARFRAKKKKREQSLERQSREKREELQKLENRISELEQENKFLKSLILTPRSKKDEGEGDEDAGGGKVKEKAHGSGERRGGKGKDGVGTSRH